MVWKGKETSFGALVHAVNWSLEKAFQGYYASLGWNMIRESMVWTGEVQKWSMLVLQRVWGRKLNTL